MTRLGRSLSLLPSRRAKVSLPVCLNAALPAANIMRWSGPPWIWAFFCALGRNAPALGAHPDPHLLRFPARPLLSQAESWHPVYAEQRRSAALLSLLTNLTSAKTRVVDAPPAQEQAAAVTMRRADTSSSQPSFSLQALLQQQARQPGRRAWLTSLAFPDGVLHFSDWKSTDAGFQAISENDEREQVVEVAMTTLLGGEPLRPRSSLVLTAGSVAAPPPEPSLRPVVGVLCIHYCSMADDAAPQCLLAAFADEVGAAVARLRSQPARKPTLLVLTTSQDALSALLRWSECSSAPFATAPLVAPSPLVPSPVTAPSLSRRSSLRGQTGHHSFVRVKFDAPVSPAVSSPLDQAAHSETRGGIRRTISGRTFEEELLSQMLPPAAVAALREGQMPSNDSFPDISVVFSGKAPQAPLQFYSTQPRCPAASRSANGLCPPTLRAERTLPFCPSSQTFADTRPSAR